MDALSETIQGVLVKPFRRMDSAMMHPPPPTALVFSIGAWPAAGEMGEWPWRDDSGDRQRSAVLVAVVYCVGRPSWHLRHGGLGRLGASRARGGGRCVAADHARRWWRGSI